VWCTTQALFQALDVTIIREPHPAGMDMAILASCQHLIVSVGTFGWWAGFLVGRGEGRVVYFRDQFDMGHKINRGNVVLDDYFPEQWHGISLADLA